MLLRYRVEVDGEALHRSRHNHLRRAQKAARSLCKIHQKGVSIIDTSAGQAKVVCRYELGGDGEPRLTRLHLTLREYKEERGTAR